MPCIKTGSKMSKSNGPGKNGAESGGAADCNCNGGGVKYDFLAWKNLREWAPLISLAVSFLSILIVANK